MNETSKERIVHHSIIVSDVRLLITLTWPSGVGTGLINQRSPVRSPGGRTFFYNLFTDGEAFIVFNYRHN